MEKIKKNWYIIIIILLLIISITSIFLNIKFNKKNIKIEAQEIPEDYENIQVTLNEDLSNKEFYFDTNAINEITTEKIQYLYNTYGTRYINIAVDVAIYTIQPNIYIYYYGFQINPTNITIDIILNNNGQNTQIYSANKNINNNIIINNNITQYTEEKYITTNSFNNNTTASEFYVNVFNDYMSNFFKFKKETQIQAPTLTRELNTLIWNNIDNATYEIWKDNQILTSLNNNRYTTISNGTYKVRVVINNNYSDFSNEITINDIEEQGYYTFLTLFGSIADSNLYLIQSMLNFDLLGFNLYQLFTALITLCIIIIVCKIAIFK